MEKVFDLGIDLILPMFSSTMMKAIDALQSRQDPPYSDGVYYIEIRKEVIAQSGLVFTKLFPIVFDPVFANLFREGAFYANPDATKYAINMVDETYLKFTEAVYKKYPGYDLDKQYLVVNRDD